VTPGYDGSPWPDNDSDAKRLGNVNGVTSLFADLDKNNRYDTITSPHSGGETDVVYQAARELVVRQARPVRRGFVSSERL